jgi:hypothetical protein
MGTKSLAEAVIMQCMRDLWDDEERQASMDFFQGEGFMKYAAFAGMDSKARQQLLRLVEAAFKKPITPKKTQCRSPRFNSTKARQSSLSCIGM